MKQLLLILIISILIAGCRTTKKFNKSEIRTATETETNQVTASKEKQNIDTNKNSEQEALEINIKFSPPDKNAPEAEPIKTGIPEVDAQLESQNLGNHGPVESISIRTTKSRDSDKSKIQTEKQEQSKTNTNAKEQSSEKTIVKEKTKPDRRWMWILIIPASGIVVFVIKKWKWIQAVLFKFTGKSQI